MAKHQVTVIPGDGIGPEVVRAAQTLLDEAGCDIAWQECEAGEKVFRAGNRSGVPDETMAAVRESGVVLKGPLATPVGSGEKSANVTLRKLTETFANIRPVRELPFIQTPFSGRKLDMTVIRENVEDVYAGIEHMQTPNVAQGLKLMSRKGCEKISRFAFEVARAEGRKSVTVATKANIMKLTEGMLKRTFEEVAKDYPDIAANHIIIDNLAHQLVRRPEQFEVMVMSNMNGDIISDLTSGLVGGLGVAPSANIGHEVSIFEAVHGSAPDIAGKGIANPTALIFSSIMMLRHMGLLDKAALVENAMMKTLDDGQMTGDLAPAGQGLGTQDFLKAVIGNLGKSTDKWVPRDYKKVTVPSTSDLVTSVDSVERKLVGAELFIESSRTAAELGSALVKISEDTFWKLEMISNRGTVVWPAIASQLTDCVDHWRCRFVPQSASATIDDKAILELAGRVSDAGFSWVHIEKLCDFDGKPAYTRDQGER